MTTFHEVYQNHDSQLVTAAINFWNLCATARNKEHHKSRTVALWQKIAVRQGKITIFLQYPDMASPTPRTNECVITCSEFTVFIDLHKYLSTVINSKSRKFNHIKLDDIKELTVLSNEKLSLKDVTGRLVFAMLHETEILQLD